MRLSPWEKGEKMALRSGAAIEKALEESTRRTQTVRKAAEEARQTKGVGEPNEAPQRIETVSPVVSPFRQP